MAEKTEPASQKKLRDARKKGQVAKAQDFPQAVTFIVSVAATVAAAGGLYDQMGAFMTAMLKAPPHMPAGTSMSGLCNYSMQLILNMSLPILGFTTIAGVFVTFITVGPVFSMEALKFDIKKLNMVENLKQKFKVKTWVELIKQMAKVTVAFYLMYTVIEGSLGLIVATAALPPIAQAKIVKDMLMDVMMKVGIFFMIVAVADLIFQRRQFAKEMKMEKFEVKQEYKDTEGDPEIKWRRKQLAREVAYDEGPRAVKRAKAVVANPTELAIALAYDPAQDPAPMVLTKGSGATAELMVRLAKEFNVPVIVNVPLAHILFSKGVPNQYIPPESFELVAQLFMTLQRIQEMQKQRLVAEEAAF
jgi:type III secretion protein U